MAQDTHYQEPLRILLVEDTKSDAMLIEKALILVSPNTYLVKKADSLAMALKVIGENTFDVVLLDLSLPDTSEFSGLLNIQNMAPKLPVIILTAHADDALALKAVEHGAQDYLFKDEMNGRTIKRAIQYAIQRKQFEGTLIMRANFDPLTGLTNRTLFESRLDMALERSKRTGVGIGVLFLDVDRFKQVNDLFGHAVGDLLLQQVAERLKQSIRPYDTAARFGGDEFALLIDGIEQASDCAAIAEKVIQKIGEPFSIQGTNPDIGASIGIATRLKKEEISREDLLRQADEAMYEAKQNPQSDFRFFSPRIHAQALARTSGNK